MNAFRDVSGKVAIIIGAASDLCKGIAETLAVEGVDVILVDHVPAVTEVFRKIKAANYANRGRAIVLDVSNEDAINQLFKSVVTELGGVDIMVNNAGIHLDTNTVSGETAIWDRIMAVNFRGPFFGCKYCALEMKRRMKGNIINIGPAYGQIRHPQSAPYIAAMEAVLVMTQALALEMAPYHVTVNTLWPGLAASEAHWAAGTVEAESQGISLEQTQALEVKQIPLGRYVGGHDLAGAILWLSSESGAYVTGQLIHVNGGLNIA